MAARLASKGHKVTIYEKLPECGGRAHMIEDKGFKFDTGPSFILMPDFFEELFSYCNRSLKDYLDFKALDISYKIFYPQGETLTIHKDSELTKKELERFEKDAGKNFDRFIHETGKIYQNIKPLLYKSFNPADALNPKYIGLVNKIRLFETYWGIAKRFFKDERLCYAFTFEAMFIGVSPFSAPAFYSIVTYVDHAQKIFHPMGGMYEIPKAIEKLAKEFGVEFNYNSEIEDIISRNGSISLKTKNKQISSDMAVINADYAHAQKKLLKRKLPNFQYSCSVYLIYLGLKEKVRGLNHHNLFFAKDLRKNLNDIFTDKITPEDPSFYIHVPTVTDKSLAPENKDILYILIPVQNMNNNREDFKKREEETRKKVFGQINKTFSINLESLIEIEHRFYPEDFIKRYNIENAATFGLSHTLMQSAFFRPPNADKSLRNIFYSGASCQPGGGLPPVIASSRIVADLINKE